VNISGEATLPAPIAIPPFCALPLPLLLLDAPSAVPPFIAKPPCPPFTVDEWLVDEIHYLISF